MGDDGELPLDPSDDEEVEQQDAQEAKEVRERRSGKDEPSGKKKRDRSRSPPSSDSGSGSDSSSDSEDERSKKRQKKEKKKEKKKKEKKDKKKKDKKKKKSKDKDKKKKKDKDKKEDKAGNLNDQCGKYGFIRVSEKFHKQDEFRAWLSEHKSIDYGVVSGRDRDELWAEYVEDFNTTTLPHQKFYDLAAWENSKARKKHEKMLKRRDANNFVGNDEELRAQELAKERQAKATKDYASELTAMSLQHQAKEKDAMAKILEMAMLAKANQQ